MSRDKNIPATVEALKREFAACGLALTELQARRFWLLHELLSERNERDGLTRVRGFYNTVYKHYIDGAMAAELIDCEGLTMDLGSGAGFPGLPMAIRKPESRFLLAEPRGRRLAFMEAVVERLGLENVEFYPHKVGPRFDRAIDNFVTRDFESVAASLSRAQLILPPGGRAYLLKGPRVDLELQEAKGLAEWDNFDLERDQAYSLGPSGLARRLLVLRKKAGPRPHTRPEGRVLEIASRENRRYRDWLKALGGRGLKKNGQALVAGRKFIEEIIARWPQRVAGLIACRPQQLKGLEPPAGRPLYLLRPELMEELDIFGAGPPLLLLDIVPPPPWEGALKRGLTLFLPFQDPANLGAAIRSAAALGARVVLLKEAANIWHPKSLRASGPALLAADIYQGPSLADLASGALPGLYALSPKGGPLTEFELPEAAGLVFGLEGPGLDELWPQRLRLSIPMRPEVESLNAAAAVAAVLGFWLGRCQGGPA